MERLHAQGRIARLGNFFAMFGILDDFPVTPIPTLWADIGGTVQSRL